MNKDIHLVRVDNNIALTIRDPILQVDQDQTDNVSDMTIMIIVNLCVLLAAVGMWDWEYLVFQMDF